jgi:hypothetical protein
MTEYEIKPLTSQTWDAFAALVFDGDEAVGWLQYGSPQMSASFLYNATRTMFERAGFAYERPKGKNHCIMRKVVEPSRGPAEPKSV